MSEQAATQAVEVIAGLMWSLGLDSEGERIEQIVFDDMLWFPDKHRLSDKLTGDVMWEAGHCYAPGLMEVCFVKQIGIDVTIQLN